MKYIFKVKAGTDFICGEIEGLKLTSDLLEAMKTILAEKCDNVEIIMNSEDFKKGIKLWEEK